MTERYFTDLANAFVRGKLGQADAAVEAGINAGRVFRVQERTLGSESIFLTILASPWMKSATSPRRHALATKAL